MKMTMKLSFTNKVLVIYDNNDEGQNRLLIAFPNLIYLVEE